MAQSCDDDVLAAVDLEPAADQFAELRELFRG
jgi:hypothetical protein